MLGKFMGRAEEVRERRKGGGEGNGWEEGMAGVIQN